MTLNEEVNLFKKTYLSLKISEYLRLSTLTSPTAKFLKLSDFTCPMNAMSSSDSLGEQDG